MRTPRSVCLSPLLSLPCLRKATTHKPHQFHLLKEVHHLLTQMGTQLPLNKSQSCEVCSAPKWELKERWLKGIFYTPFEPSFRPDFRSIVSDFMSGTQTPLAEVLKDRYEAVLDGYLGEKRSTPRNIVDGCRSWIMPMTWPWFPRSYPLPWEGISS